MHNSSGGVFVGFLARGGGVAAAIRAKGRDAHCSRPIQTAMREPECSVDGLGTDCRRLGARRSDGPFAAADSIAIGVGDFRFAFLTPKSVVSRTRSPHLSAPRGCP